MASLVESQRLTTDRSGRGRNRGEHMTDFNLMLAKPYSEKRVEDWSGIHVEPKWDGIRVVAIVDSEGEHKFYSRNGRELLMLDHLKPELFKLGARLHKMNKGYEKAAMFDGEIVNGNGVFEDVSGVIHLKDQQAPHVLYKVFHAMPLELFEKREDRMPQAYRSRCLSEAMSYAKYSLVSYSPPIKVDDDDEVQRFYVKCRQKGYEGAMVKNLNEPWRGKRSWDWMKMKAEETADIRIKGFKPGTGKYEGTLGALICRYKKKTVNVSGMTDEQRDMFWKGQDKFLKRYIEVTYQNITNQGKLRHPRFKRLRPDKDKK
jgi:DNA ligase 1